MAQLDMTTALTQSDAALEAALFPPKETVAARPEPDWALIDEDLRRHKMVTRKLLWAEYKAAHPDGYEFSQFKEKLRLWQKASGRGLSMRQVHRAGEAVQVDYAGDTVMVSDGGVARTAQIFVACLPVIRVDPGGGDLDAGLRGLAGLACPAVHLPRRGSGSDHRRQSQGRRDPPLLLRPGHQRQLHRPGQALPDGGAAGPGEEAQG